MRTIGRKKAADTPSTKMNVSAASVSDFPKEKSCLYPITKGRALTAFFAPFLLKRKTNY